MTIFPRFVFPWLLLLLVLVPWSVWVGMSIQSLSGVRKWTAIALRSSILILLIAALAGAEIVRTSDKLAVFFLLDHSDSIPESHQLASAQWVRNAADTYMLDEEDEAGVIVFGDRASIELSVAERLGLPEIMSYVGGEQSDLAGAIRLAMAAFPEGYMKRIVVYTDGNETRGAAVEEAKIAQAAGVEISTVPIDTGSGNEVRLREISVPSHVNAAEPFQVRVVVSADQDGEATLRLFQQLGNDRRMLAPQRVTLQKGDNTFLLSQEVSRSGFFEYEARIESEFDTVMANNEARAFTVVRGEPVVLYVEGDSRHSRYLRPALEEEGLGVIQIDPGSMPSSLAQFQNFNVIVLSDVSSIDLSMEHLNALEAAVRDLGIGLVMVGGPESFGAGGYLDTPVERALPVDMNLKEKKIVPKGALALILHTVEISGGNAWARDIGIASLNVLSSRDLMAVAGYTHNGGDVWLFPLQPVGDKSSARSAITRGSTQIGDMPSVAPTLRMAYEALAGSDAAVKRVIMISDGDPAAPSNSLLDGLADAAIPVSTICIAPHSPNDQNMLRHVANRTGGQYYFVTNPNNLPLIFTKEASVVRQSLLVERPFVPQPHHGSELLLGLEEGTMPELLGYVMTMPKENATVPLVSDEGDPILAHWRYGLGKSVAFTSDVTNRWAAEWLGWDGFSRFWAQTVRWASRELKPSNFRVETSVRDGKGHIKVDAVDETGKFINYLKPTGRVTGPEFDQANVELLQTGPGIYEGTFPADETGTYMVNVLYEDADGAESVIPTGLAVGYSREYEYTSMNLPLLEQLADVGGGRVMTPDSNPFEHTLTASEAVTPIWHVLVVVAACLFPVEIFVRRVVIDFSVLFIPIVRAIRKLPALANFIPEPRLRPAAVTGAYTAGRAKEFEFQADPAAPIQSFAHQRVAPEETQTAPEESKAESKPAQPEARTEYTQQLLAAKERALAGKRQRPAAKEDDKEEK